MKTWTYYFGPSIPEVNNANITGYRRPLDDNAAFLGDFTWDECSTDEAVANFDSKENNNNNTSYSSGGNKI